MEENKRCIYHQPGKKPCRQTASSPDSLYCRLHSLLKDDGNARVVCPCCKQQILEDRLARHSRKCSAPATPSYLKENCNSFFLDDEEAATEEEEDEEGEGLKRKVATLYWQHVAPILIDESGAPPLHCDARVEHLWHMHWHQKGMRGPVEEAATTWRRHRKQEAALAALMLNRGLLPASSPSSSSSSPSSSSSSSSFSTEEGREEQREERAGGRGRVTTVVDFGSGKGSLCVALASVCRDSSASASASASVSASSCLNEAKTEAEGDAKEEADDEGEAEDEIQFLCVDRSRVQYRAEKTVGRRSSHRTHRLRADLSGLDLGAALQDEGSTLSVLRRTDLVLGVGKHLCGPATDMCLQALARLEAGAGAEAGVEAGVEAWDGDGDGNGVGDGAEAGAGAGARCKGLAIATCCHSAIPSMRHTAAGPWLRRMGFSNHDFSQLRRWAGGFTAGGEEGDRGRQCKRLIDYGRREFVQRALGLRCELVTYTDASSSGSPENCCLIAYA